MKKSWGMSFLFVFLGTALLFSLPKPVLALDFNGEEIPAKINGVKVSVGGEAGLTEGLQGKGLKLNGGDDRLKVYQKINLPEGAIVFWIRAKSFNNEKSGNEKTVMVGHYIKTSDSKTINRIYMEQKAGTIGGYYSTVEGDAGKIKTRFTIELDTWYQFAFVWKDGNASIYANGKLIGKGSSEPLTEASRTIEFGKYWNGVMDEIKIFDKSLKESEINELYKTEKQD